MTHQSPQQIGEKEAKRFLRNHDVPKDAFVKEGEELSKQYRDEYAQKGYLQGWEKTWPEDLKQENVMRDQVWIVLECIHRAHECNITLSAPLLDILYKDFGITEEEDAWIYNALKVDFPSREDVLKSLRKS